MKKIAQKGGIEVIDGVAESLPFADSQFDFALMVTTICFVIDGVISNPKKSRFQ